MKSLFRQLRERFLKEGQIGKYLIYALGEIILIVAGILIALQISAWNEARRNAKLEIYYLNRIAAELNMDIERFIRSQNINEENSKKIREYITILNSPDSSDELLVTAHRNLWREGYVTYNRFSYSSTAFDELISTGNLRVITDSDLRVMITNHYRNFENRSLTQTSNEDRINSRSYLVERVNNNFEWKDHTADFFPERTIEEEAFAIRGNADKFRRSFAARVQIQSFPYLNLSLAESRLLLKAIEEELEKR